MLVGQQNNGSRFLNFVLCQILVKRTGRISIWAGLKLFFTHSILLQRCLKIGIVVLAGQLHNFHDVLQQKLSYLRHYLTIGRLLHHAFSYCFCCLVTRLTHMSVDKSINNTVVRGRFQKQAESIRERYDEIIFVT